MPLLQRQFPGGDSKGVGDMGRTPTAPGQLLYA